MFTDKLRMDDDEFDELDYRSSDQYWSTIPALKSVNDLDPILCFSTDESESLKKCLNKISDEEKNKREIHEIIIKQLSVHGFTISDCEKELENANGHRGNALDNLFRKLVNDPEHFFEKKCHCQISASEQREEESMALESIYEENFKISIKDKVWRLFLKLEVLTEYLNGLDDKHLDYMSSIEAFRTKSLENKFKNQRMKYCKYYTTAKGCRFGEKCINRHASLGEQKKEKSDKKVTGEELMKAACLYTLEIRLNDHYPERAAVVYFTSRNMNLSLTSSLKISAKLLSECCLPSAENQEATVFSCASFLEDLNNYKDCL